MLVCGGGGGGDERFYIQLAINLADYLPTITGCNLRTNFISIVLVIVAIYILGSRCTKRY